MKKVVGYFCKHCNHLFPRKKVKRVVDSVLKTPFGNIPTIHHECPNCLKNIYPQFEEVTL